MPGLIDMHYHIALASTELANGVGNLAPDVDFLGISASLEAERLLKRGFTSIRDVGGPSWGATAAADRGMIAGPRTGFETSHRSRTGASPSGSTASGRSGTS